MSEHEEQNPDATPRGTARALLLLRAGGLAFAVYADECECVTPWAEPAPLPHAPAAVLGVASVRGRMRTVLDPARLFEAPVPNHESHESQESQESHERAAAHALIASLAGDEQLALACESSATHALGENLSPPESPALPARGTFRHGAETVHLLDPARLFEAAMSGTERRRQRGVSGE